jgi:hypothetical protein
MYPMPVEQHSKRQVEKIKAIEYEIHVRVKEMQVEKPGKFRD